MLGKFRGVRLNVLVVGDSRVGKTALIRAKLGHGFEESWYIPTVYDTHTLTVGDGIHLTIWDTAGQQDFDQLREITAYRSAYPLHAILICIGVDQPKSFESVENRWLPELMAKTNFIDVPVKLLVGLKSDLRLYESSGTIEFVDQDACQQFAEKHGLSSYFECSARSWHGVEPIFAKITENLSQQPHRRSTQAIVKSQIADALSKIRKSLHELADDDATTISDEFDSKVKLVFIGDAKSGKNTLAGAIGTKLEVDEAGKKTLDLAVGVLPAAGTNLDPKCQLPMMLSFYCGHDTDVIVLCVAIDQPQSLKRVTTYWLPEICDRGMPRVLPMILVGTKKDLRSEAQVSRCDLIAVSEAKRIAKLIGAADYIECSALTGDGLELLREAAAKIYQSKATAASSATINRASLLWAKLKEKRRSSSSSSSTSETLQRHAKIVVVGDCGCGKFGLVKTLVDGEFPSAAANNSQPVTSANNGESDQVFIIDGNNNRCLFDQYFTNLKMTIGATEQVDFELEIWKTSGADQQQVEQKTRYNDVLRAYSYPGTDAVLLCCAVDQPLSMRRLNSFWMPEIRLYCPNVPVILVGTKADLLISNNKSEQSTAAVPKPVTRLEGERMAKEIGAFDYVECSAKSNPSSVRHVFETATRAIFITAAVSATSSSNRKNIVNIRRIANHNFYKNLCKPM